MYDARLKGTKCVKCFWGRELNLDDPSFLKCADCIDRPNRNKDKSRFEPDVESEDIKKLLDDDAKKGTPMDF